jgi:hypothetical protein
MMKKANGIRSETRDTSQAHEKNVDSLYLSNVSGAWPVPLSTDKINAHAYSVSIHLFILSTSISRPSLRDVLNKKRTLHLFNPQCHTGTLHSENQP